VTYTTFDNFINGLRESGIPNRIDRSVMDKLSGANQSFLMGALRFLGLTTETGTPTTALKALVEEKDNKQVLEGIIRDAYDFLFTKDFNLQAATEAEVSERFRKKDLSGDTIRKAMSFFTLACGAAGIPLSPHLKGKRGGGRSNGNPRRPRKPKTDTPAAVQHHDPHPEKGTYKYVLPLPNNRQVTVIAPMDISEKEIPRITKWMEVTLELNWNGGN
jgi:hypothetical protein